MTTSSVHAPSATLPRAALYYEVSGPVEGAPLLLLRPLGGDLTLWGRFGERLAERHRVVAYDYRGTGRSSGVASVSTRAMAREAAEVLQRAGVEAAHVFGLSLGGMVATWLAAQSPERVRRLVLASAPARGLHFRPAAARRGLSLAHCLLARRGEVEPCLARRVLSDEAREDAELVARVDAKVRQSRTSRGALMRQIVAGALHDGSRAAARIVAPTLLLAGQLDRLLGTEAQLRLAARIPQARFEVVDGVGHDLVLEAPERTAQRVTQFLEEDS